MEITFDYDDIMDVMYVKIKGSRIKNSYCHPEDGNVIINLTADKKNVGLQLLDYSHYTIQIWQLFNDGHIAPELFHAVLNDLQKNKRVLKGYNHVKRI